MTKRLCKMLALLLSVVLLLSLVSACAQDDPPPDAPPEANEVVEGNGDEEAETPEAPAEPEETPAEIIDETEAPPEFQQAPMLDGMDLPPVEERIPTNPLVITPWEMVGTYGGTWNKSVILGNRVHALAAIGFYEGRNFLVWDMDKSRVVPNLASSVVMNDDGTVFTFTLRDGLRWSDGHPMTSADVLFWFEASHSHPEVNPGWEGAAMRIESVDVIDEITFSFTWNVPNPLFYYDLAGFQWTQQFMPKHYMSQFHPDFSDQAEALADEAGASDWVGHFGDRNDWQVNPDLPTMAPFVLQVEGAAANVLLFERNPFFWAVDTEGNQLPYLDSVVINIVESADIALMRVAAGEIDMQMATVTESFLNFPFLAENADAGGYEVRTFEYMEPGAMNIHFNLSHLDPYKSEIFQSHDFRRAMSYSLNREFIIATNFTVGPVSSTPRNFSPAPTSPFFDAEWSAAHTEYNVDLANELLDGLGLTERNAAGIRLLPNGEPFRMIIDVPFFDPQWIDVGIMIAEHFTEVGIEASANSLEPALWNERRDANDFDATIMTGGGGMAAMTAGAVNEYTGFRGVDWPATFQQGFILQRISGEGTLEIPEDIERLWELGAEITREVNPDRRQELLDEIFQIHKDNLFVLNIGTRLPGIYIVSEGFMNVPPLDGDWTFGCAGHGRASQYFIR